MRRLLPVLLGALLCAPPRGPASAEPLSTAARWLQSYLRVDTTNPPGGEHRGADLLARILTDHGIRPRRLVSPQGRVSLYARQRARPGADSPALLLLHHMDVVGAGVGWSHPPFGGVVADGKLWGRGALDAKGIGIAHLAACVALARSGRRLGRDVIFLATADEERGGGEGTGWLLERHPELFGGLAGVLNEGGANRRVGERVLWWGVEVAQKRPFWLEVSTTGRGGHGAGFNPQSAPHQLVQALARLLDRPLRWRVTPEARTYLRALAPLHPPHWRPVLSRPEQAIGPEGPRTPLLAGMENLFLDTVQLNVLAAAAQINVIPPRAVARIDVRLLPDTDEQALVAELQELLGTDATIRILLRSPRALPSPTDGAVYQLLAGQLEGEAPLVPFFSPGFTDSRFFRERGVAAYGFSPFALRGEDLRGIHGVDEGIPLDELDRGVERTRRIVEAWAADGH